MSNNYDHPNKYIAHIVVSYLIFASVPIVIGSELSRIESYCALLFSSFLAVFYLFFNFRSLKLSKSFAIAICGLGIKLLIGYLFWSLYMWPDYFSDPDSVMKFNHHEYLLTPNGMIAIADYRISHGFFSISDYELNFQGKYFPLHFFMSNIFLSGNKNIFDLSIQNSIFSFYTAILATLIGKSLGCNDRQARILFFLVLFEPFSLNSAAIWRDTVGQTFVFLGVYLLISITNTSSTKGFFLVVLSSLLMAMLRSVYVIIPFVVGLVSLWWNRTSSLRCLFIYFVLILFSLFILYLTGFSDFIKTGYGSYLRDASIVPFISVLPLKILKTIVGPFPWVNWLEFNDNTIFLISHYLQSVYVMVILLLTFMYFRRFGNKMKFVLAFIFFIFFSMSLFVPDVHFNYFSFAVSILLPISIRYLSIQKFLLYYLLIFFCYLLINIFYIFAGY